MPWACEDFLGRRPHFFKIFFPYINAKHLGIPRGFLRHIEPQTLGYVGLTGPSGNVWNAKLVRTADGGMSFQNGWEEFVADHALGFGDFLLFRYDGDMNFSILVFDPTSCEKEDTFNVSPCHEFKVQVENRGRWHARDGSTDELVTTDSEINATFARLNTCERENNLAVTCQASLKNQNALVESPMKERPQVADGSSITKTGNLDSKSRHPDMVEHQVGPSPLRNMELEIIQIPASSNKFCEDDLMENRGVIGSQTPHHLFQKKAPSSSKHALRKQFLSGPSNCMKCDAQEETQNEQVKIRMGKKLESHRRPVTEDEKAKALEAALLFQSKHPFCRCVMRNSYVYRGFFMYLPSPFTRYLPKYTTEMKLRNRDNKLWRVMYKYYGTTGALSAGWCEFSRANNLEKDDVCIFELIKPHEIRVYIFRVVEEITPYVWNSRKKRKA